MRRFIALCTLAAAASVTVYASDAAAAPLKCVSNDVNAGPAVVSDTVFLNDPVQKGHLYVGSAGVPATPSTCAAPKVAPAVVEATADFHYKAHAFKNRSAAAACVEVRYVFTGSAAGTGLHEATAYLGGFDPNDPAANYLGDSGHNDGGPDARVFSFTVPAMNDFTLVATWAGPATPGYEPKYDLYVANCGQMVLTGITPNAGPITGGQNVTIAGSGFEGAAPAVAIGVAATNVVVVDDSTLIATTAANAAGTYDVTATSGAAVATLAQAYTYGALATDAGTDAGDAGLDGGDAGRDAGAGGPTTGGPTQGSSSSSGGTTSSDDGGATNVSGDDDDDGADASTGDGGAKRVSAPRKKRTGGEEEYVCACNEVGKSATPGMGAFATLALGILAVLRIRKRR